MYSTIPMRLAEHRDALIKVWSENMTDPNVKHAAPERLRWLYDENPSGSAQTWLLLKEAEVIGCGSIFPREMRVGGRIVKSGVLADFAVDKAHRTAGPALTVQRAIARESKGSGFEFVYAWPNDKSVAVVKRVGYQVVGNAVSWVKPLRTLANLKKLKPFQSVPPAAHVAAPLGDAALLANDIRLYAPFARKYRTKVLDRADERFDDLWERAKSPYVVGKKSQAYLNWRYAQFTTARFRFFCLFERKTGKLAGYIVYKVEDHAAFLGDLFCENLDEHVAPLLVRFALYVRREGARTVYLTYVGTPRFTDQLHRLGFRERVSGRSLIVDVDPARPAELRDTVLEPANWLMFDGELDI